MYKFYPNKILSCVFFDYQDKLMKFLFLKIFIWRINDKEGVAWQVVEHGSTHGLQVSVEKDSAQWKREIDYQAQFQHGIQDRIQAPS